MGSTLRLRTVGLKVVFGTLPKETLDDFTRSLDRHDTYVGTLKNFCVSNRRGIRMI